MNQKKALVLGATGGVGGEVAQRLLQNGWSVRALVRKSDNVQLDSRIEKLKGDAMNAEDVISAAEGVCLIVHAVNPPGYKNWGSLVLPMIDNTIRAARQANARILLPGTIYNYGSNSPSKLTEETPQEPTTKKGEIRKELENRLLKASQSGVRVLIVRCGDFFGPRPGNNWFSQGLIQPGHPVKSITYPGRAGIGHAWAYLPDVAQVMVELAEKEGQLKAFESFHFGGYWDHDGRQMIQAIQKVSGVKKIKVKAMPWMLLKILSPFVTLFREMMEMQYLWQKPYQLENRRLIQFLGYEPVTPLDQAVEATLKGLGCLQ